MIKLGTFYIVFEDVIAKDDFFNLNRELKKETGCYLEVRNHIQLPDNSYTMMAATLGVHLTKDTLYKKYGSSNILMMNCVSAYIKKWHVDNQRNVDVVILNVVTKED